MSNRRSAGLLAAGVLVLLPVRAGAQVPFQQTVVVTAAARPIELGSAPRTLTVITREQIAALPVHSVADVLRLAASVDVRARGERGVQTDFAVRGANFGQMLVLVDGVRLNDAQSGHHNGDIPVPLEAVERIEVLYGSGSSLFGADAFGGTVNVITRRAAAPSVTVQGGRFNLAGARGAAGYERGAFSHAFSGAAERSGGFIPGRDFVTAIVRSDLSFGGTGMSIAYLRKEFGARNFYGATATGDAMSREWTNQTLVSGHHAFDTAGGWTPTVSASYRTHGDRFLFNAAAPAAASVHRTHETLAAVSVARPVRSSQLTMGAEGGGTWIRSNNLGRHESSRVSGFAEWRQPVGGRAHVDAGLRVDRYSEFGTSTNPSLGAVYWAAPSVRVRATTGRAFRVPTFTERFYSDRNHLARSELTAEHAWSTEGGVDLFPAADWVLQATVFRRAERDVIDWLCGNRTCGTPAATERWRTYNIRDVDTVGLEVAVRRTFGGSVAQASYTALDVDAETIAQLSKYVLDYAPHSLAIAAAVAAPARLTIAPRLEYKHRTRPARTQDYVLLDLRVTHRVSRLFEIAAEGTNLLDADYQEIPGVVMPAPAFTVSLAIGR